MRASSDVSLLRVPVPLFLRYFSPEALEPCYRRMGFVDALLGGGSFVRGVAAAFGDGGPCPGLVARLAGADVRVRAARLYYAAGMARHHQGDGAFGKRGHGRVLLSRHGRGGGREGRSGRHGGGFEGAVGPMTPARQRCVMREGAVEGEVVVRGTITASASLTACRHDCGCVWGCACRTQW